MVVANGNIFSARLEHAEGSYSKKDAGGQDMYFFNAPARIASRLSLHIAQ